VEQNFLEFGLKKDFIEKWWKILELIDFYEKGILFEKIKEEDYKINGIGEDVLKIYQIVKICSKIWRETLG